MVGVVFGHRISHREKSELLEDVKMLIRSKRWCVEIGLYSGEFLWKRKGGTKFLNTYEAVKVEKILIESEKLDLPEAVALELVKGLS